MLKSLSAVLYLAVQVSALPSLIVISRAEIDPNNPSASDPKTPPSNIAFPQVSVPNPFPSGIPIQPDICDGESPSEDCFKAMESSSGEYLYFDKDSGCTPAQKTILAGAVWDAMNIANFSTRALQSRTNGQAVAPAEFYMGNDWLQYSDRIIGNLDRASKFKTSATSSKEYITISCKDTKSLCSSQKSQYHGKSVGGYAWTYNGWFAYYYYITLCPAFFTLEDLNTKFQDVQQDLSKGITKMATDIDWLRHTGMFFLHEMMHLRLVSGDNPHINDEWVEDFPPDSKAHSDRDRKAYGGKYVVQWYSVTKYFPGVPSRKDNPPSRRQDDSKPPETPIFLCADLDNSTVPAQADLAGIFAEQIQYFDPDDVTPLPSTTKAPPPASTTTTAPKPSDICGTWYKVLLDHFEIYGKDFDATKFGNDGEGLHKQVSGCGDLTSWEFKHLTNDPNGFQWSAKGNLQIGTKACVGRAVMSAGGGSPDGCTGAG